MFLEGEKVLGIENAMKIRTITDEEVADVSTIVPDAILQFFTKEDENQFYS